MNLRSGHDHSCWRGRKESNKQTNKEIIIINHIYFIQARIHPLLRVGPLWLGFLKDSLSAQSGFDIFVESIASLSNSSPLPLTFSLAYCVSCALPLDFKVSIFRSQRDKHSLLLPLPGLKLSVLTKKKVSYFSNKTNVVGTQKNGLNERFFWAPKTYVKTDG